ncbi:unnamed protein product [Rotaria sordida]|uniref:NAD(P)(+)--arginine ADP-ribosyltransferase n=2 Tax=Rotaria sordida TaxID=392033 RepID=A0A814STB8_9BILA|nr:unnamed protein product [Rotaria sordida]CAF3767326.1 unnamed protein product [Rotaria sordida]
MPQSIDHRKVNVALRRLPTIRPSVTIVWIEDSCTSSRLFDNNGENMNYVDSLHNHFIVWYTSILKSIKYFKQARSYERIIVVVVLADDSGSINKEASTLLLAMPHDSSEAKREMLVECRAYYRGKHKELVAIDKFEHSYCSADAIKWYTRPCFLYRIVNKALRSEDILGLYTFRYFIADLCTRLEEVATLTRARYTMPFRVYRGARLSKNEVEELRVGTLVATNGYMSSSIHLNVAQLFISIDPTTGMSPSRSRDDKQQFVLFEIDINLTDSSEIIVADVSDYSAVPDEKELLFDLGTTFIITNTEYDIEHYLWHIRMVSSSEMAQLRQDYSAYINRRLTDTSPTMMFGHLLSDISSDYSAAMNYFYRLLRTISVDDEDHPTIYFYLARLYRFIGKHKKAIEYFQRALLLQKPKLPQSSMAYGRALAGLATTYSEMGESTRAVLLYERAMAIHRAFLPSDHIEMIMDSNRLAYAYWQEKQYERALAHLSSALTFYRQKMPVDHPGQAQALHTMGLVHHTLGNREQALDYYTKALHMRQSLLSNDHPFVARTYYQMSLLHAEQDDERTIALDYAQRALNIRYRKLPPNHKELNQSIELVKRLSQKK